MIVWILWTWGIIGAVMAYWYFFKHKRNGDENGWWWFAGAVVLVGLMNGALDPSGISSGSNCYTDWDGRSNSVVCN